MVQVGSRSLVLALLIGAGAPAPAEEATLEARVDEAIDRGVRWLLHHQELDGSYPAAENEFGDGLTAFVTYTLLKSGVPSRHHAVRRALVRLQGAEPRLTYDTGALLLALGAHPEDQSAWMQEHLDALLSWRTERGFGYPAGADLSNTQFGALGLWAAARAGLEVPSEVWVELIEAVFDFQQRDGGFLYKAGRNRTTHSMTAAGLGVLAICRDRLRASDALDPELASLIEESFQAGVEWLAEDFRVSSTFERGGGWHLYYLYGLERIGALWPVERIGEHDWYREGALELLDLQLHSGQWQGAGKYAPVSSTCFALLFLQRATKAITGGGRVAGLPSYGLDDPSVPVALRAQGDADLELWIGRLGRDELRELCHEGESSPRIERVDYLIDDEVVSSIPGNVDEPADLGRFRTRHTFVRPGLYRVQARVRVLPPGVARRNADAFRILSSEPLEVDIIEPAPEWMLALSREARRNLLRPGKSLEIDVSSRYEGDVPGIDGRRLPNQPFFLVDNSPGTAWVARERERKPKLRMDLEEPVEADTVVLLPVQMPEPEAFGRARLVEVVVNKRYKERVEMHPDPRSYTVVDLGRVRSVERLDVKVLKKEEGSSDLATAAVGFAEVQLQLRAAPREERAGDERGGGRR